MELEREMDFLHSEALHSVEVKWSDGGDVFNPEVTRINKILQFSCPTERLRLSSELLKLWLNPHKVLTAKRVFGKMFRSESQKKFELLLENSGTTLRFTSCVQKLIFTVYNRHNRAKTVLQYRDEFLKIIPSYEENMYKGNLAYVFQIK